MHTTCGELLHKLVPSTKWMYPHLTTITRNGSIVIHYTDQKGGVVVYTCNGEELCQQSLGDRALVSQSHNYHNIDRGELSSKNVGTVIILIINSTACFYACRR